MKYEFIFFDNALTKQGKKVENILIRNPVELYNKEKSLKIIFTTRKYQEDIIEQLQVMGLKYQDDFVIFSEVEKLAVHNYIKKFCK